MEIFLGCLQHTSVQDGRVDGSTGDVHWKSKHWYQITVDTHVFFVWGFLYLWNILCLRWCTFRWWQRRFTQATNSNENETTLPPCVRWVWNHYVNSPLNNFTSCARWVWNHYVNSPLNNFTSLCSVEWKSTL